ncbi:MULTISPECIES: hypothetical protein [Enterococcus]|nr:hypothetical protein [Enterococcus dispar]MCU7357281.1 hypothetical protein [Enterococcus dispar]MDT2705346.1 hypothetical protein [Enterococcus dispar]OJG38273.1 hypothetical protein RV01_GL000409 [Enterococcus dispar]WCG32174.1 hypothetical protein PML78_08175 [Enterococcus dispar]
MLKIIFEIDKNDRSGFLLIVEKMETQKESLKIVGKAATFD